MCYGDRRLSRTVLETSPSLPLRSLVETAPRVSGTLPWLGHGFAFGRDPVGFIESCRQRHGDVFTLQFPGGRRTLLLDPHDYAAYFKDKRLEFGPVGTEFGELAFGYDTSRTGSLDMEELTHTTGRRLQGKHLASLDEQMQRLLGARLAQLDGRAPRDGLLMRWIQEHVFAAGTEALCGPGFYAPQVFADYERLDHWFPYLLAGVPSWMLPGCRRARRRFAEAVDRRRPGRAVMLELRDEAFARHAVPADQAALLNMAWIWASQVNTLNAMFWTLFFVLRDPKARAVVEEEVRRVCGCISLEPPDITEAQLRQMVSLDAAITEALRLSSGPMATRRARATFDFETDSGRIFRIERGEHIDLFPYATHLDPEIYEDPSSFRHDRFLGDGQPPRFYKGGRKLAFPLLVFGAGASMCPGRFLARNEIKTTLALLFTHFDVELRSEHRPALDFSRMGLGVLPPKDDVPFRLQRRR